jgi:hypothetical protein
LETHWLKPSPSIWGIRSVSFKNGLVVRSCRHLFSKPVKATNYDLQEAVPAVSINTEWADQDGSFVPRRVVSTIRSTMDREENLLIVADIKLVGKGNKLFDEKKVVIDKLLNRAKNRKKIEIGADK